MIGKHGIGLGSHQCTSTIAIPEGNAGSAREAGAPWADGYGGATRMPFLIGLLGALMASSRTYAIACSSVIACPAAQAAEDGVVKLSADSSQIVVIVRPIRRPQARADGMKQ